MAKQGEYNLKHVALLRKVIMEERSGVALFAGEDWDTAIPFDNGAMLEDVSGRLALVLQEPVFNFSWKDSLRLDDGMAFPTLPRHVFSRAVAVMSLPTKRMIAYRQVFAKLPRVKVRYLLTFRANHDYQMQFQILYRMALERGGVDLEDYFALAVDFAELRKRVNIVIAAYCMGDLLPAEQEESSSISGHGEVASTSNALKVNVVSRILARLRGREEG